MVVPVTNSGVTVMWCIQLPCVRRVEVKWVPAFIRAGRLEAKRYPGFFSLSSAHTIGCMPLIHLPLQRERRPAQQAGEGLGRGGKCRCVVDSPSPDPCCARVVLSRLGGRGWIERSLELALPPLIAYMPPRFRTWAASSPHGH